MREVVEHACEIERNRFYSIQQKSGSTTIEESVMLPTRIILADRLPALTTAWSQAFADFENIEISEGDFLAHDADALVSPANSFGIMDGGLDAAIRAALGAGIQSAVQKVILEKHHGEMPVGTAEVVPTDHARWPFLVVAPTMRIPESIPNTLNSYLAFRAALLAVVRHNASSAARRISTLVVPGMGTGIGLMDPRRCAAQMRIALDHVSKPPRIPSFSLIHQLHHKLRSAT